jgi:hypothetical protein
VFVFCVAGLNYAVFGLSSNALSSATDGPHAAAEAACVCHVAIIIIINIIMIATATITTNIINFVIIPTITCMLPGSSNGRS